MKEIIINIILGLIVFFIIYGIYEGLKPRGKE